ncbi:cytochrome P450 [Chlamydoabsidia padenii]|nr:cytochrome P450 [Chlamydoabsidia padenii]
MVEYRKTIDRLTRSFSERSELGTIGIAAAVGLTTYTITKKLYDAYIGPLKDVPSPFYAKFFTISKGSLDKPSGTIFAKYLAFNDKYGTVMKLGPSTLLISDKAMLKQIIQQDDLEKGPVYDLFRRSGMDTTFSTRDKEVHKRLRRLISPAFSIKYLNSLEGHLADVMDTLMNKIENAAARENYNLDIWKLFEHSALDMIGTTAFGQSFNMLETESHPVPDSIAYEMRWASWVNIVISQMVIQYDTNFFFLPPIKVIAHPYIVKLITMGIPLQANPVIRKLVTKTIHERIQSGKKRNDILQILLDTQEAEDPNERLSDLTIILETILFLIVGSETTSSTLGFAVIELLRHPHAMKKLQDELDTVEFADQDRKLYTHEQLKSLPYLNAVLNETLRLNTVIAGGLERRTEKDITLGNNLVVPKGTGLVCNIFHAHLNEEYWPNARSFEPERWLPDADVEPDLDAFYPFSAGSRNCVGKNFAWMEMRLVLATLIKRFELTPLAAEMEQAKEIRHYVSLTLLNNSFSVLIRPRLIPTTQ